jgi:hypothetical protein
METLTPDSRRVNLDSVNTGTKASSTLVGCTKLDILAESQAVQAMVEAGLVVPAGYLNKHQVAFELYLLP